MQLSLFGDLSIPEHHQSRTDDPPTSKAGAKSVKIRANSQMAQLLVTYLMAFDRFKLTDDQAAEASGLLSKAGCCWWKRCSDLRALGLIESVGTGISPLTGEERMTCEITQAGMNLAHTLLENKCTLNDSYFYLF
jgi:hypothetical protein